MDSKIWALVAAFAIPFLNQLGQDAATKEDTTPSGGGIVIPPPEEPSPFTVEIVDHLSFEMLPGEKVLIKSGAGVRINGALPRKRLSTAPDLFGEAQTQVFDSGFYADDSDDIFEIEVLDEPKQIVYGLDTGAQIATGLGIPAGSGGARIVLSNRPYVFPKVKDHPWVLPAIAAGDHKSVYSGPYVVHSNDIRVPLQRDSLLGHHFDGMLLVGRFNFRPLVGSDLITPKNMSITLAIISYFPEVGGRPIGISLIGSNEIRRDFGGMGRTAHWAMDVVASGFDRMWQSTDPWFHDVAAYEGVSFDNRWSYDDPDKYTVLEGKKLVEYNCKLWNGEVLPSRVASPWANYFNLPTFSLGVAGENVIKETLPKLLAKDPLAHQGWNQYGQTWSKWLGGSIISSIQSSEQTLAKMFLFSDSILVPVIGKYNAHMYADHLNLKLERALCSCLSPTYGVSQDWSACHPRDGYALTNSALVV